LGGTGRAQSTDPERDYFAVMMELDTGRIAPWFRRTARKSVYMFDAWPPRHPAILKFVADWGVQFAFVSSRQAAERLGKVSERCTFIWVPEGVDPGRYQRRSSLERDIDVLQLGRKFDTHHALIAPALERAGRSYVYEREKGKIIFPVRQQFIDGLARSRISICVPSSLTHPERAGDIETMTIRYLQSMASKCLVLGHAPAEMVDLFGYNPVVEIDDTNAAGQVLDLLANYESYQPLIEKNYAAVTSEHTWDKRWNRMAELLFH
ncbi:MAG: glycosyltransferase, partial [Gemmatimonadota bacterium]|nr:glycosyltransferase [Gemmatimonadota bacterium]